MTGFHRMFVFFCAGIAAGVMAACVTFVVQASQESNIRGVFTGEAVRSNTNWPAKYRWG